MQVDCSALCYDARVKGRALALVRVAPFAVACLAGCDDGTYAPLAAPSASVATSASPAAGSSSAAAVGSSSAVPTPSGATAPLSLAAWLGVDIDPTVKLDHPLHHDRARLVVPTTWAVQTMTNGMSEFSDEGRVAFVLTTPHARPAGGSVVRRDAVVFLISAGGTSDLNVDTMTHGRLYLTGDVRGVALEAPGQLEIRGVPVRVRRGRCTISGEPAAIWQVAPVPGTDSTALVLGVLRDGAPKPVERELLASLATFTPR
jgi:hypothetical protein